MKINEGMRDAVESMRETAIIIERIVDSHVDNVTIPANDSRIIERGIERLTLSLYHLQRCERLEK